MSEGTSAVPPLEWSAGIVRGPSGEAFSLRSPAAPGRGRHLFPLFLLLLAGCAARGDDDRQPELLCGEPEQVQTAELTAGLHDCGWLNVFKAELP